MINIKNGEYVNIGDEIANEQEYLANEGSTYCNDGKIFAGSPGILKINKEKRIISVDSKNDKKRKIPEEGDLIIGQVYSIRKHSVGVFIKVLNQKPVVTVGLIGNIHISNAARRYIDKLDEVFQDSDLIRAKVLKDSDNEYKITTNGRNLGVIKSQCKYCGTEMVRKSSNQVICPFCHHYERKILANDFGNIKEILQMK